MCPNCEIGELVMIDEEGMGDYQCPVCRIFLFGYKIEFIKKEEI